MAVAAGGTTARSAPEAAGKTRLTAFGSCGQLLGYAKGQMKRFVGPYGYGGLPPGVVETAVPAAGARAAAPVQGVDFSGTNVQEEGVDEPDLVKTNGKTLFAVANGSLRAVDVSGLRPRLLDSLPLERALSHELLLHGDRLLAALARRLLDRAAARNSGADRPVPAGEVRAGRGGRVRSVPAPTRAHAHARRRLRRRAARRLERADRRRLPDSDRAPVQAADRRLARGDRRGRAAQRGRRRALEGRELAALLPRQAGRRQGRQGAPARPVPPRPPRDLVLRPRHAHRPHRRPGQGPPAGRLGRGDDRRPHRLRVAREPLRRHRALGRPARSGQADRAAERRPDRDPQVRHLEPGEDALPRQRQGLRLPAQPVVAVRASRRPPRRQHREPRLVGRRGRERSRT